MRRSVLLILLAGCGTSPSGTRPVAPPDVPARPEALELTARPFDPPRAEDHRVLLLGRIPAYLGQNLAAPAFRVTLLFRTGTWLDPQGKEGLADAAAQLLRQGGTERLAPDEVDRELENRAIEINASAWQDSFEVTVWSLSRQKEEALRLLVEVLQSPRFDQDRLKLWKRQTLQALSALHDRPGEVRRLYWRDIIWGADHPVGRRPTRSSVERITRADLRAWHATWITAGNAILVATSEMPREDLSAFLGKHLASWQGNAVPSPWSDLPAPPPPAPPGLYLLNRDMRQGSVRLGHRGIDYGDPRSYAFQVLSHALGGGSFQSRLMDRLRTQKGLTYGIVSHVVPGWIFPGTTIVDASAKPENVAQVIAVTVEEIDRLWKHGLSEEELDQAKETIIARFAGRFEDLHASLTGLGELQYRGRALDYYSTYRTEIRAVSLDAVCRAAKEFLRPDALRILVVGDIEAIRAGAARASIRLEDFGPVSVVDVRDPMK